MVQQHEPKVFKVNVDINSIAHSHPDLTERDNNFIASYRMQGLGNDTLHTEPQSQNQSVLKVNSKHIRTMLDTVVGKKKTTQPHNQVVRLKELIGD